MSTTPTKSADASGISEGEPVPGRDTDLTRRARYYTPPNSFTFSLPEIPCHAFVAERDAAFDPKAPAGFVTLDLSKQLAIDSPATTPMMLMRFARLKPKTPVTTRFKASSELYYVLSGSGQTTKGDTKINWHKGDLFLLPGGWETIHTVAEDSLLYVVTNEPQLALERAEAPVPGNGAIEAVHYPAEEIERQWRDLCVVRGHKNIAGKAVLFLSEATVNLRTITPTLSVGLNAFEPGDHQMPHRHNAVAVTLCIQAGPGVYSKIDDKRVDWSPGVVMLTPPQAAHSHHNEGKEIALSLVVQDSGLYYHTRAVGFGFA